MNEDTIRDDLLHEINRNTTLASNDMEAAVRRVGGLTGVANDIDLALNSRRNGPDGARSVLHEMEHHVGLPSTGIKVTAEDGWVTLEGNVDWHYRKALAESLLKKLIEVWGHQQPPRDQTGSFSGRSER